MTLTEPLGEAWEEFKLRNSIRLAALLDSGFKVYGWNQEEEKELLGTFNDQKLARLFQESIWENRIGWRYVGIYKNGEMLLCIY